MKEEKGKKTILLTGATGYIGQRILPLLLERGFQVICAVRDKDRFNPNVRTKDLEVLEIDLMDRASLEKLPPEIHAAYYLVHSMSSSKSYQEIEEKCARNFRDAVSSREIEQVIYLTGMANEDELSEHLQSRLAVEKILAVGEYHLTALRAGIIIGSGSASFEIIRDLVEKLPFMVAPKWLKTKCQPIGVVDVLSVLDQVLLDDRFYDENFDIGSPDILSYKEMLKGYAKARGLKRSILTVPVMTPRLSSYWLYFVTSTSYKLATALVDSMKIEVVARDNKLFELLDYQPMSYEESLDRALSKVRGDEILSSWKDAMSSGVINVKLDDFIQVPTHGCLKDIRKREVHDPKHTISRIWKLGGKNGWYYGTWLWRIRGWMDKLVGGVGLRRGRTHQKKIEPGDALDFWRVLVADKDAGRLLLLAEMKLPGEAWLEFKIEKGELVQTATFRPKGIFGRLYWWSVWPFHGIVFRGMINRISA